MVKFSFPAFSTDFFFFLNFVLKTYGTLKMFLLSAQKIFYIILSSYVEGHVQKNSSLNFMSPVGFQASKIWNFLRKISWQSQFGNYFQVEITSQIEPPEIIPQSPLLSSMYIVWRNQESCESWLVGLGVSRHSKKLKISANNFFWRL